MGPNYSSKVPVGIQSTKLAGLSNQTAWCHQVPDCSLTGNNFKSQKIQFMRKAECSSYVLPPRFSSVSVFIVIGLPTREHLTDFQTIDGRKERKVGIVIVVQPPAGFIYIVFVWLKCCAEEAEGRIMCWSKSRCRRIVCVMLVKQVHIRKK